MGAFRAEVCAFVALFCLSLSYKTLTRASSAIQERDSSKSRRSRQTREASAQRTHQAAAILGVRPPSKAPLFLKRLAWKLQRIILTAINDDIPDSKLSLRVLWWKALSAADPKSPVFDDSLTYDMLPTGLRFLTLFWRLYPRWIQATIEVRTAYLDQAVRRIVLNNNNSSSSSSPTKRLRLITLGGGYDVRSVKLSGMFQETVELDLPQVVASKTRMFQRLRRRRPNVELPALHAINLHQIPLVEALLLDIIARRNNNNSNSNNTQNDQEWHTIFLFEGVLLYLDPGVPSRLLEACRRVLDETQQTGTLCFADALEHVTGDDLDNARDELAKRGWRLTDWLPKGGKARHMGTAEMMASL